MFNWKKSVITCDCKSSMFCNGNMLARSKCDLKGEDYWGFCDSPWCCSCYQQSPVALETYCRSCKQCDQSPFLWFLCCAVSHWPVILQLVVTFLIRYSIRNISNCRCLYILPKYLVRLSLTQNKNINLSHSAFVGLKCREGSWTRMGGVRCSHAQSRAKQRGGYLSLDLTTLLIYDCKKISQILKQQAEHKLCCSRHSPCCQIISFSHSCVCIQATTKNYTLNLFKYQIWFIIVNQINIRSGSGRIWLAADPIFISKLAFYDFIF